MSYLRIAHRPLGCLPRQGRCAPFLYYRWSGVMLGCCLAHLFRQDRAFFLPRPADYRFHAADVQRDPAIPSYVWPAPPVSSLCLDTNEEIDLQTTRSPGCWSLHLCQMNQMWEGELLELLVAEAYSIVIGAKPLHIINETFCSIPINGDNCCYLDRLTSGASVPRYKPTKNGVRRRCVGRLSDD